MMARRAGTAHLGWVALIAISIVCFLVAADGLAPRNAALELRNLGVPLGTSSNGTSPNASGSNLTVPPCAAPTPAGCPGANASLPGATQCSTNCGAPLGPGPTAADLAGNSSSTPGTPTGLGSPAVRPIPASWSTFYQEGGYYQGPNLTGGQTIVYTSIFVPSSGTVDGDQYAAVLSVFDNRGYYDQIGLASDYGCPSGCNNPYNTWTIAYEQGTWGTGGCGWGGQHSRDGVPTGYQGLPVGAWYTFLMYLTGSHLVFKVFSGVGNMNSSLVWYNNTDTDTATTFGITSAWGDCAGHGYDGGIASATLYQEVFYTASSSGIPNWDFPFWATTYASWCGSSCGWGYGGIPDSYYSQFNAGAPPSPPHGYWVDFSEANNMIVIANQAFRLTFDYGFYNLTAGGGFYDAGYDQAIGVAGSHGVPQKWRDYCLNNTCAAAPGASCSIPLGWVGGCGISPTKIPDSWTYNLTSPLSSSGWYYLGATQSIVIGPATEITSWIVYVYVG